MRNNFKAVGHIDPDAVGHENRNKKEPHVRPQVKNLYCPRDGHYCEQLDCGNCMGETVGDGVWQPQN